MLTRPILVAGRASCWRLSICAVGLCFGVAAEGTGRPPDRRWGLRLPSAPCSSLFSSPAPAFVGLGGIDRSSTAHRHRCAVRDRPVPPRSAASRGGPPLPRRRCGRAASRACGSVQVAEPPSTIPGTGRGVAVLGEGLADLGGGGGNPFRSGLPVAGGRLRGRDALDDPPEELHVPPLPGARERAPAELLGVEPVESGGAFDVVGHIGQIPP